MDKMLYILPVLITVAITSIFKIVDIICKIILKKQQNNKITVNIKTNLLCSQVSYERFEKVAKESLRPNSPIRNEYDFLDFLIKNMHSDSNIIENKIL